MKEEWQKCSIKSKEYIKNYSLSIKSKVNFKRKTISLEKRMHRIAIDSEELLIKIQVWIKISTERSMKIYKLNNILKQIAKDYNFKEEYKHS